MTYCFRLANLVGYDPDPNRRPGTIKKIVENTGLDRHLVSAILRNEAKSISLEAISQLCQYLIHAGFATAEELPGALFGLEAETFWEMLACRKRVEICLGVRRDTRSSWSDNAWIVAADSLLLGSLLRGLSQIGGSAKDPIGAAADAASAPRSAKKDDSELIASQLDHLEQRLVWSPDIDDEEKVHKQASEVYDGFLEAGADSALVTIGSIKSNPVSELTNASIFRTDPYANQDDAADPQSRSVPIFLRYRDDDPKFDSCCAGMQLAKNTSVEQPGYYYETESGEWECCPWEFNKYDVATVVYELREPQARVEMSIGGFSGQSTRWLADLLNKRAREFWPPVQISDSLSVGAFLVAFEVDPEAEEKHRFLGGVPYKSAEIIRLDDTVIQRRLMV